MSEPTADELNIWRGRMERLNLLCAVRPICELDIKEIRTLMLLNRIGSIRVGILVFELPRSELSIRNLSE